MQLTPKYSQFEIERRWLVSLEEAESLLFEQMRSINDRYIDGTELRLRTVIESGKETIFKLGKKYAPEQIGQPVVSVYLSESEASVLSQLPARVAIKQRLSLAGGALDIYESPRHRFAIFEIEFAGPEESAKFTPPPFVGQEVTGVPDYTGYALAGGAA